MYIHNILSVKSYKILKKKVIKLYSLNNFISVCAPFFFESKFSNYKLHSNLRIKIISTIKEILKTLIFILDWFFFQKKNINKINLEKKIFFFSNKINKK